MPDISTYYGGSKMLNPVAQSLNLRIDQLNHVFAQYLSLLIATYYYRFCITCSTSRTIRLFVPLAIGIGILFFCFGCPLMMVTQRVTSLACSLHDGSLQQPQQDKLSPLLRREIICKRPTLLEFMAYCLSFQWVLCGPWFSYSDFIDFIDDRPYWKNVDVDNNYILPEVAPDPKSIVFHKLGVATLALILAGWFQPIFQVESILGSNKSILVQLIVISFSLFLVRCQYYCVWTLAEAATNASGFGFSGLDKRTGKAVWNRAVTVYIYEFEMTDNWRSALEAWNCGTLYWLRRVAYERAPGRFRMILTYVLSAWWHGFYPGYYMTFATGALFTHFYKHIRPLANADSSKVVFYNMFSFFATKLAIAYVAFPFVFLHFQYSFVLYKQLYFSGHVIGVAVVLLLPLFLPSCPKLTEDNQNNNIKSESSRN